MHICTMMSYYIIHVNCMVDKEMEYTDLMYTCGVHILCGCNQGELCDVCG